MRRTLRGSRQSICLAVLVVPFITSRANAAPPREPHRTSTCVSTRCDPGIVVTTEQPVVRQFCFSNCAPTPTTLAFTISDTKGWCTSAADTVHLAPGQEHCVDVVCTPSFQYTGCPITDIKLTVSNPEMTEFYSVCNSWVKFPDGLPEFTCSADMQVIPGDDARVELCFRNPSIVTHEYYVYTSDAIGWLPRTSQLLAVGPGESHCELVVVPTLIDATCAADAVSLLIKMRCDRTPHRYLYCGVNLDIVPAGRFHSPVRTHDASEDEFNFGAVATIAGDLNGDGHADYVVASPNGLAYRPGRVSVFFGGPQADEVADLILSGSVDGDNFGSSVTIGELSGDGAADLVVRSRVGNAGLERVLIYRGGTSFDGIADVVIDARWMDRVFGYAVAVPDVNGDGYGDLLIAAQRGDPPPQGFNGVVYLHFGGPLFDGVADLEMLDRKLGEGFGLGLAGGTDFNGDHFNDFAVSTLKRAYVFYGGPLLDGVEDVATDEISHWLASIALADVNGDRLADLLLGGPRQGSNGQVMVHLGSANASGAPDTVLEPLAGFEEFGVSLAAGADLDSDGFQDLVVGSTTSGEPGHIRFYRGGPDFDETCEAMTLGEEIGDEFAATLDMGSDITGDGIADLVVGAPGYGPTGEGPQGKVYIYSGAVPTDVRPGTTPLAEASFGTDILNAVAHGRSVQVDYTIGPAPSRARLDVYDVAGRLVHTVFDSSHPSGVFRAQWDGRGTKETWVGRGVYLLRLRTNESSASHKVVLR